MKTRPIMFSAPMVKALLNERKTQTRRLATSPLRLCEVGDQLWVREAHYVESAGYKDGSGRHINYRATEPDAPNTWTPSIHMPRWASRLTLEVTGIGVFDLQDISPIECMREGIALSRDGYWTVPDADVPRGEEYTFFYSRDPLETFARLWDSLHGAGAWKSNPEVVAIAFKVHKVNVDKMGAAA